MPVKEHRCSALRHANRRSLPTARVQADEARDDPVDPLDHLSSALDLAVRYDWAERNVAKNASPPHPRKREPDPPTPELAARLLNLVWTEDEEFGSPGLHELHRQEIVSHLYS